LDHRRIPEIRLLSKEGDHRTTAGLRSQPIDQFAIERRHDDPSRASRRRRQRIGPLV